MQKIIYFNLIIISLIAQSYERDPRLFGKWILLYSMNSNGEILRDEFFGKGYIEEYTKDGRLILDPQFLLDDMKRRGEITQLDYTLISTFEWMTVNNNTIKINYGELGIKENRYGFLGDTLIIGYPNGHTRYLLKRK